MDVGVVVLVVVVDRLDHRARPLAGRGVVEIHERLAVDLLVQDREVAADALDVEVGAARTDRNDGGTHEDFSVTLVHELFDVAAHCERSDRRDDRFGERADQQGARVGFVEPARAQVEEGGRIELADGRAVAALHVVRVDLELRLGVDLGACGEQQVAARLARVGLLRARPDDDLAVEHAAATLAGDAAIVLVAGRVRGCVIDRRVRIQVLGRERREQSVQRDVRAGPLQRRGEIQAGETRAQRDVVRRVAAVRLQTHVDVSDVEAARRLLLNPVVLDAGAGRDLDVADRVREALAGRCADKVLDQHAAAVGTRAHDDAGVAHHLRRRVAPLMHDVDRLIGSRAGGEIQHHAVFEECEIEVFQCAGLRARRLRNECGDCSGIVLGPLLEREQRHAGQLRADRRQCRHPVSIDEHDARARVVDPALLARPRAHQPVAGANVRASSRRRFVYFQSSWRCVGNPAVTKRSSAARRSSTSGSLAGRSPASVRRKRRGSARPTNATPGA